MDNGSAPNCLASSRVSKRTNRVKTTNKNPPAVSSKSSVGVTSTIRAFARDLSIMLTS